MNDTKRYDSRLIVTNVRCLKGSHSIRIAPLTILVGENSSGKSTVLAMLSSVLSAGFPLRPSFNEQPFELGGFSTIATKSHLRSKRIEEFSIGLTEGERNTPSYSEVVASYSSIRDTPTLSRLSLANRRGTAEIVLDGKRLSVKATLVGIPDPLALEGDVDIRQHFDLSSAVLGLFTPQETASKISYEPKAMSALFRLMRHEPTVALSGHSVAPIRTKPRRVYDGLESDYSPEGDHVPPMLARALRDEDPTHGSPLLKYLSMFGHDSGLFERVKGRFLGKQPSAPFQLLAHIGGVTANVTDVGYGVSQILPILIEARSMPSGRAVLAIQQPEVHLHPRAQAELGSLFARMAAQKRDSALVIETHSDHILDRVRMEVARKTLEPEDISLLFLEKRHAETTVHPLTLDSVGNITNAPRSYRAFFLKEEFGLLNRSGR